MKVLSTMTRTRRLMVLLLTTIVLLGALVMMTDAWFDTPSGYSINSPTSTTYESLGGGSSSSSNEGDTSSSKDDGQTRYSILQQLMALKKKLTSMDSSSKQEDEFVFPGQQQQQLRSDDTSYYSQKQQYTPYDYGSTGFFPLNVAGIASITESRDQTNEFLGNMQASYRPYRTGQNEIKSTSAARDMGGDSYGNQGFYPIPADQQQQQQQLDQSFRFPGQQDQQQQQQQLQQGFRYPGQQDQLGTADLPFNQGGHADDTSVFFDTMKRGYEPYISREAPQVTLSSSDWNQLSSTGFFFPSYANAQLQSDISSGGEGDQTSAFSNIMKQNYMPYSLGVNEIPSPATVGTEFRAPGQLQQQDQQSFRFPGQQGQEQQDQQGFRYPGGFSQTGLLSSQQSSEGGDETNQFLSSMRNNYSPYSTGANVQPSGEQQQQQWNYGPQGFFSANNQQQQQQSTFKFPGQ